MDVVAENNNCSLQLHWIAAALTLAKGLTHLLGTEPLGTEKSLSLTPSAQTRRQGILSGQEGRKEGAPSPICCVTLGYMVCSKMPEKER